MTILGYSSMSLESIYRYYSIFSIKVLYISELATLCLTGSGVDFFSTTGKILFMDLSCLLNVVVN